MPYMTKFELMDPGKQPLTIDVPTRRTARRKGRYHRHPFVHKTPYMLIGETPRDPMGKRGTVFSPLHGMGYGVEEQLGQFAWIQQAMRDLATATGIRDPIAHYEPGLTLPEVYAKYSAQVDYYLGFVRRLRSQTAQVPLMKQLMDLARLRNRISPAFRAGAVPGERDRDRLAELVAGMRNFRKDWNAAKARYGVNPIPPPTISLPGTKPVLPPPPKAEIPILPIAVVAAVLALA